MLETSSFLGHHAPFLEFLEKPFFDFARALCKEFWRTPADLRGEIREWISSRTSARVNIVTSGETKNVSIYLYDKDAVLVLTPLSPVNQNIILRELYPDAELPRNKNWCLIHHDPRLLRRLAWPKILLINPCVLENFPVPRLCLSVGLVASYLRKYQRGEVRILDMQFGVTVEQIAEEVECFEPRLIGMSVSYGQKFVAFEILDKIVEICGQTPSGPLLIVGNIIPASFPEEFIDRYPGLVVATGEGETTALALAGHLMGEQPLSAVPGLARRDADGRLRLTPNAPVPMAEMPLPALDTVYELHRCRGALTVELSRGCQWNRCTFCPREHKSSVWKSFTTEQILEQFAYFREISDRFSIRNHLFLADEEYVGGLNDGDETARLSDLARRLHDQNLGMSFDSACRADQVYDPQMSRNWHVGRLEMWDLCYKAGLDRLFMGIESGSDSQLRRYGKGLRAEDSVRAIRLLSALGIPLRFGFIMFDQLMVGLDEVSENIAFLERTDAFMKPINVSDYGYEKLFDLLVNDEDFVRSHAANKPVFTGVSYMLASMEVLINSNYAQMLRVQQRRPGMPTLIDDELPDTNMGRYKVHFVDPLIRDVSTSCQKWIDRHFGLAYTVKSLYKVAPDKERPRLMAWMVAYRGICLQLAKALVYIFDENPIHDSFLAYARGEVSGNLRAAVDSLRDSRLNGRRRLVVIENCLEAFDESVEDVNDTLRRNLDRHAITDNVDGQLGMALERWRRRKHQWKLINDPNLGRTRSPIGLAALDPVPS